MKDKTLQIRWNKMLQVMYVPWNFQGPCVIPNFFITERKGERKEGGIGGEGIEKKNE